MDTTDGIEPPNVWCIQSPFGVLKTNNGLRLARLEDVHAWLMQRDGMSSASAVARVFGAFAADTNSAMGMKHGAEKVRESLHVLDLSHDAEPVRGWAGRHLLREVAELIPYVPHHRFDRGTAGALMYALGLMAGEVWAPHDVEIDLNDRLEGYCAEGYFPTVKKAREILGRFAVPFAAAHALWGWGTAVTDAVATPAPSKSVLALVPAKANNTEAPISEPSPWRKDRKVQAAEWTGERLTEKRKTLKGRDTTQQLAQLTGLPAREITRREKLARDDAAQALKAANRASGVAA